MARIRASKVLNHAVNGRDQYAQSCAIRFVASMGLRSLFAAFMDKVVL